MGEGGGGRRKERESSLTNKGKLSLAPEQDALPEHFDSDPWDLALWNSRCERVGDAPQPGAVQKARVEGEGRKPVS